MISFVCCHMCAWKHCFELLEPLCRLANRRLKLLYRLASTHSGQDPTRHEGAEAARPMVATVTSCRFVTEQSVGIYIYIGMYCERRRERERERELWVCVCLYIYIYKVCAYVCVSMLDNICLCSPDVNVRGHNRRVLRPLSRKGYESMATYACCHVLD